MLKEYFELLDFTSLQRAESIHRKALYRRANEETAHFKNPAYALVLF